MDFAQLSRLSAMLLAPGNLLLWLVIAGVGLLYSRYARFGRSMLLCVSIAMILIAVFPVGAWLAKPLEDRYPRVSLPTRVSGILVLSGGLNTTVFLARGVPAAESSDGRMLAARQLLDRYPDAKLIFSGGIAPLIGGTQPETVVARYIFGQMQLPPSGVTWESRSRNTWENFLYSRNIANPKLGDNWILITSALNMPRAMGVASRLCWHVLPWPSDYISGSTPASHWKIALASDLETIEMDAHEWLGLLAYAATGRLESGC